MAAPLPRPAGPEWSAERPAARPHALALSRLTLADFRNYAGLRLEAGPGPVVLTGPNGAGKTNLLEALSFLTPGRGLRRARLREIDRRNGGPWAVAARLFGENGVFEVGTGRTETPEVADRKAERRLVRIDGEPARGPTALAEHVSCVWLTPAMDRLLAESASPRRRFLDRLVFTLRPEHAARVAAYEHSLRERGRLLRAGRADPAWLDALEARAGRLGAAIAAARRTTVAGLNEALAEGKVGFPRPHLAARGRVEGWLAEGTAPDEAGDRLRAALRSGRPRDAETGGAGTGPHRSDLFVFDPELDQPAERGSTGRQKALLLSVVLAEARLRGRAGDSLPLLLLDEVAAHLDRDRRDALFAEILALGAQAWLTGTDKETFAPLKGHALLLTVHNAGVLPDDHL